MTNDCQPKVSFLSGSLNHLSLSVSDMKKSLKFYRFFCQEILGYEEVSVEENHAMWFKNGAEALCIQPGTKVPHNKFNPGLHHVGFNADSREQVDGVYKKVQAYCEANKDEELCQVLDAPADYDYLPKYYAVFFTDPDGMKLEIVHTPQESFE
ncbi:hypothetical protein BGW38_004037 [Lunasporangiospora selenospora]|uniref:VOC domain-containing protein n=1 Tax=Lunasporangiospora selenospora TaxID=979761 RepID=A0A9P6G0Z5_9FUNG|nr:hypothetical protein BGW38_004037 [Lunasporangiospora selenospora]